MTAFPGINPEYLFYKCNIEQFFLWHDRATEKLTGKMVNRDRTKVEDIYDKFEYSEELKKWVPKNGDTSR